MGGHKYNTIITITKISGMYPSQNRIKKELIINEGLRIGKKRNGIYLLQALLGLLGVSGLKNVWPWVAVERAGELPP